MRSFFYFQILFSILLCLPSLAFIPPAAMILQRTAENNGQGIYLIELEVLVQTPTDTLALKETWLVENENSMKLLVSTNKDNRDVLLFSNSYRNGHRQPLGDRTKGEDKKLDDEFIEKYFHFRNSHNMAENLVQMRIALPEVLEKKKIVNLKNYSYRSEDFLRLSRTGGVVTYAFGSASPALEEAAPPGLWIEQDQFVLRKIRLPSQVEISADKHSAFSRGLIFPKVRLVRWENKQIQINTLSVVSKARDFFPNFGAKVVSKSDLITTHPAWFLAEEFYKRFR